MDRRNVAPTRRPWLLLPPHARTLVGATLLAALFVSSASYSTSGQGAPQLQIDDLTPAVSADAATPNPASRLSQLVNQKLWTDAEKLAQDLVGQQPGDPLLHYYLGLTQVHFHDSIGAVRSLRAAER